MAKRTTKPANSNELDGKEFFAAIAQIEQEKGIKPGYMMEKITQALLSAYRRDHEGVGDNLVIDADPDTCTVRLFLKKDIVEEVDNPATEISLEEARLSCPRPSWAMWSAWRSSPRTLAAWPPRPPARSSSRASARPSRA